MKTEKCYQNELKAKSGKLKALCHSDEGQNQSKCKNTLNSFNFKPGAFSLVELIVTIVILAILGTISFMTFQGYSIDARDAKRISDTRNLLTKIDVEQGMGMSLEELMNVEKENSLTINGKSDTPGFQGTINYDAILENSNSFRDSSNNQDYPFAYSYGITEYNGKKQSYNFVQLAYVSEREGITKLVGNYFQYQSIDSPSLFTHSGTTGENNSDFYTDDDIEQIYDIGEKAIGCNEENIDGYDLPSTNHNNWVTIKKQEINEYLIIEYSQKFKCSNGSFEKKGEEGEEIIGCSDGRILQGNEGSYTCEENKCDETIPDNAKSNATDQIYGVNWTYSQIEGICTYTNEEGYHTEDGGETFILDTRSCDDITNGTGEQTRNTTEKNRGICTLISCESNHHQVGNTCVLNTQLCVCELLKTLPTNAERNTVSYYTQTWNETKTEWEPPCSTPTYNTTPSNTSCRYKEKDGYHTGDNGTTFTPNNCVAYNNDGYTLSSLNHGSTTTLQKSITITGGTQTWKIGLSCSLGNYSVTSTSSIFETTCNTGYEKDGNNCKLINYEITYDSNGGTLSGCTPPTYTITSSTITPTCTTKARAGYTFDSFTPASIEKGSTGDKTIIANWTSNSNTITIDENGGQIVTDLAYTTSTGSQTKTLTPPTRANSTFSSWSITTQPTGGTATISTNTLTIPANAYGGITVKANYTCNGGHYESGTSCVVVGTDHYSPAGENGRTQCPAHSTTNGATTSDAVDDCLGSAGYRNCGSGTCSEAGTGWYSPANSNGRTQCPELGTTDTTIASASTQCKKTSQACTGIPNTAAYVRHSATITQTYNGSNAYTPSLAGSYSDTAVSGECRYKCGSGYSRYNNACTANSCISYTAGNGTFTKGTPTQVNQTWQTTNSSSPCYVSCSTGYTWNSTSCVAKTKAITSATHNSRTFTFTSFTLTYGTPQTKTSSALNIANGTSKLTATFTLGYDGTTVTLSNASEEITCNAGHQLSGTNCIEIANSCEACKEMTGYYTNGWNCIFSVACWEVCPGEASGTC